MFLANEFAGARIEPDDRWNWQREAKMGAPVRAVRTRDAAAMRGDNRLANRQTDTDSCILGAEEAVENVLKVGDSNAWAIVEHGKDDRTVFTDRGLDIDPAYRLSRLRNRLDAVDQQVGDHLLQLNQAAHHAGKRGAKCRRHSDPLREDCTRFGGSIRGQSWQSELTGIVN
jgi:hypothetical protein